MTGGLAAAWGMAGLAVLVAPTRRRAAPGPRASRGAHRPGGRVDPRPGGLVSRSGPVLAAFAAGVACVSTLGLVRGAIVGAVVAAAAWPVLSWLQRRPAPRAPDPALPLVLDLVAAALRSGRPLADALDLAADAARADVAAELRQVAGLWQLGADAAQAWSAASPGGPLAAVAPVAIRSARSGIKIATAFERLAADLRAERAARQAARAHRAGVVAMAPLAACFLPSFVCLGVVPVIVGIASSAFDVLPGGR